MALFLEHLNNTGQYPQYPPPPHTLTSGDITRVGEAAMVWLNEKYESEEWSARTVARRVASLRAYAKFMGWPPFMVSYKAPKAANSRPHPLPEGMVDVNAMMNACSTYRERALIALCGYMGLRVGEALSVRVGHVDVPARWLTVRHGKGRRERRVPIPERAVPYLQGRIDGAAGPYTRMVDLSDRGARQLITNLGEKAGVERRVSSHDLRATAATHWYKQTKDLRTTQELLGHADSRTTEVYTGVDEDDMRKAINS